MVILSELTVSGPNLRLPPSTHFCVQKGEEVRKLFSRWGEKIGGISARTLSSTSSSTNPMLSATTQPTNHTQTSVIATRIVGETKTDAKAGAKAGAKADANADANAEDATNAAEDATDAKRRRTEA